MTALAESPKIDSEEHQPHLVEHTAPTTSGAEIYRSERNGFWRPVDPIQLRAVRRIAGEFENPLILDIGCAQGGLVSKLGDSGLRAVGLDVSARGLLASAHGATTTQADALIMPFANDTFEIVTAMHLVEHVERADLLLEECARVTKPGGVALFAYPAEPIRGLFAVWSAVRLYGTPLRARDVHVRRWLPRDLEEASAASGFSSAESSLSLLPMPQFISALRKGIAAAAGSPNLAEQLDLQTERLEAQFA